MKKLLILIVGISLGYWVFSPKYVGEYKGWSVYTSFGEYLYKCNYRHDQFYSSVNLIENPNGEYINKEINIPHYKEKPGLGVVSRNVKKYYR